MQASSPAAERSAIHDSGWQQCGGIAQEANDRVGA